MKNIHYLIALLFLALASCGGTKTSFQGLANESYLEFLGNPNDYSKGVEVVIDDKAPFQAKVYKDKTGRMLGEVYSISTGNHILKVYYENKMIFNKQIFISAQESKKIILP
ncbi:hypothetical protein [Flavobacterium sp.]|uniref:hypothetical protein n=1 Tax=Flavobacterium sp. TaxID=239 RepID=UPI00375260CC